MTRHGPRRRRGAGGWMSGMKGRGGARRKTPLWQWILGVPAVGLIAAAILGYAYITYFNPSLARTVRTVPGEIVQRVERSRPDGALDLDASYLIARVEGREVRLIPRLPEWNEVAAGDTVQVELATSPGGVAEVLSWSLPQNSAPGAGGP